MKAGEDVGDSAVFIDGELVGKIMEPVTGLSVGLLVDTLVGDMLGATVGVSFTFGVGRGVRSSLPF